MDAYSNLATPFAAAAALGVIVLLCRWVFSTTTRDARSRARATRPREYGLLTPVATVPSVADADLLRERLHVAGIRATAAPGDGGTVVLVFPADAAQARGLVGSQPGS